MAEEPTSVQGLNSADALQRGIGLRLDRRFAGVNSRISVGVGLLMTVLSVGGYALWSEFHGLKADFARARGDTDVIKEQAADQRARLTRLDEKLDKNLAEIVRSIRQAGIPTASPVSTTTPERTSPFVALSPASPSPAVTSQGSIISRLSWWQSGWSSCVRWCLQPLALPCSSALIMRLPSPR